MLQEDSFSISPGGRTIILGPNGAGKSLLLRVCHGLLHPDKGSVTWAEPDRAHVRHRQAMVFQRPVMLRRSVRENLDYPLKLRRVPAAERQPRVEAALQMSGLSGRSEQQATSLSIGEQQRLALARAKVLDPEVLFLDEPTASLDPAATGEIERMIASFDEAGVKIVMTTHDLAQARRLAGEVMFLHGGQLLERGEASAFFASPDTEEARAYLEGRLLW